MYKGRVLLGHNVCTKDQSNGIMHVPTHTYVHIQSQLKALCHVQRASYIGTQHAQGVDTRNTYTQNNTDGKKEVAEAQLQ